MWPICQLFIGCLACASLAQTTLSAATFHSIGAFPGDGDDGDIFRSYALDVSASGGVVLGFSGTTFVLQDDGDYVRVNPVPGSSSYGPMYPRNLSEDGRVVVGDVSFEHRQEAFRWLETDGILRLGDLPGGRFESRAFGVSSDGRVIVGDSASRAIDFSHLPDYIESEWEAFRWTPETGMVGLGDLPGGDVFSSATNVSADGSVVVGQSAYAGGLSAFRWTQATGMIALGHIPGARSHSVATNVSNDGNVVVGIAASAVVPESDEAMRWTSEEGMVGLGDLPGGRYQSGSAAVSADGRVVVGGAQTDIGYEAFIWDAEHGMRNLREVLRSEYGLTTPLHNWILRSATDISTDGRTIVGIGRNPDGFEEGWVARLDPIPEPHSIVLAAMAGAAALWAVRRRHFT